MFRHGAFLVLACTCLLAQGSSRTGVIRGVVLDSTSHPVSEATVRAYFGGFQGVLPSARTDKSGHFVIEPLSLGRWFVTASKEQDGYPDEANSFYGGLSHTEPTIDLKTDAAEQTVT